MASCPQFVSCCTLSYLTACLYFRYSAVAAAIYTAPRVVGRMMGGECLGLMITDRVIGQYIHSSLCFS